MGYFLFYGKAMKILELQKNTRVYMIHVELCQIAIIVFTLYLSSVTFRGTVISRIFLEADYHLQDSSSEHNIDQH